MEFTDKWWPNGVEDFETMDERTQADRTSLAEKIINNFISDQDPEEEEDRRPLITTKNVKYEEDEETSEEENLPSSSENSKKIQSTEDFISLSPDSSSSYSADETIVDSLQSHSFSISSKPHANDSEEEKFIIRITNTDILKSIYDNIKDINIGTSNDTELGNNNQLENVENKKYDNSTTISNHEVIVIENDNIENTENTENTEKTEKMKNVENTENTENTANIENTENIENSPPKKKAKKNSRRAPKRVGRRKSIKGKKTVKSPRKGKTENIQENKNSKDAMVAENKEKNLQNIEENTEKNEVEISAENGKDERNTTPVINLDSFKQFYDRNSEQEIECWYFSVDGNKEIIKLNKNLNPNSSWEIMKEIQLKYSHIFPGVKESELEFGYASFPKRDELSLFIYFANSSKFVKNILASLFAKLDLFGDKLFILENKMTRKLENLSLAEELEFQWTNLPQSISLTTCKCGTNKEFDQHLFAELRKLLLKHRGKIEKKVLANNFINFHGNNAWNRLVAINFGGKLETDDEFYYKKKSKKAISLIPAPRRMTRSLTKTAKKLQEAEIEKKGEDLSIEEISMEMESMTSAIYSATEVLGENASKGITVKKAPSAKKSPTVKKSPQGPGRARGKKKVITEKGRGRGRTKRLSLADQMLGSDSEDSDKGLTTSRDDPPPATITPVRRNPKRKASQPVEITPPPKRGKKQSKVSQSFEEDEVIPDALMDDSPHTSYHSPPISPTPAPIAKKKKKKTKAAENTAHQTPAKVKPTIINKATYKQMRKIVDDNNEILADFDQLIFTLQTFADDQVNIVDTIVHKVDSKQGPPRTPLIPYQFPAKSASNDELIEKAKCVLQRIVKLGNLE